MARASLTNSSQLPSCDEKMPTGLGLWYSFPSSSESAYSWDPYITSSSDENLQMAVYYHGGSCDNLSCFNETEDFIISVLVYGNSTDTAFTLRFDRYPRYDCGFVCQGGCEYTTPLSLGEAPQFGYTGDPDCRSFLFEDLEVGSCGNSVFVTSFGTWYTVQGTGQPLTVSTCSEDYNDDTQISVFGGDCGDLQCIDGNDQSCGDQSAVSWFTQFNITYYVLVHGYGTRSATFAVQLTETDSFSNTTSCDRAIQISPGKASILGTTASTSGTSQADISSFCGGFGGNGHGSWFQAIGTGQTWTASTCTSNTSFVARVSIFRGDTCDAMACVADTVVSRCGNQNAVTWSTIAGQRYFVFVHGTGDNLSGDFILSLEETASNDECNGAIGPLSPSGKTQFGSTQSATYSDAILACGDGDGTGRASTGRGVYYSVAGTGKLMTVSSCNIYTNFDAQISVYNGTCSDLQCVSYESTNCHETTQSNIFDNDVAAEWGVSTSWNSTVNEMYFLLLHGKNDAVGNYAFDIS